MDKQSIIERSKAKIEKYKREISKIEGFISYITTLTQEDLQNLDKEEAVELLEDYCRCVSCTDCLSVINHDYCFGAFSDEEFLDKNYNKFIKQIFKI